MLKFIKGHVASISGIDIYPIVSFLIFFLFFLGLLAFVVKISKEHAKAMAELPLEADTNENDLKSLNL
jgi:hypothetical protein